MDLPPWLSTHQSIHLFVILQLISCLTVPSSSTPTSAPISAPTLNPCNFTTENDNNHFKALHPLVGQNFIADFATPDQKYTFYIGICAKPCPDSDKELKCEENVGVVQTWMTDRGKFEQRIVGRFDNAIIQGSDRWKMLTYFNGDEYNHHCTLNSERKANLMFTCDESLTAPIVHVLEENSQRNDSCYYLIEIASNVLCPKTNTILPKGVSAGSVLVILLVVAVSCYLVFGFLYRRIVVGAKGIDQVPNLPFWQNVGNLMADGCEFAFRTKPETTTNQRNSPGSGGGYQPVTSSPGERVYKGLGDDILSNENTNSADDTLLPM